MYQYLGVGAVLTDLEGKIIAQGRNRICDDYAPSGRLRSTALAHAEIDVLGQLRPGDYSQHTLWTTLEPCLLCSSAVVMSNIGIVRFAANDLLWSNIVRIAEINDYAADRWPARHGPLSGPISVFCELLPLVWSLKQKPDSIVINQYAVDHPHLLQLAEQLVGSDQLRDLKYHPIDRVLDELWNHLLEIYSSQY